MAPGAVFTTMKFIETEKLVFAPDMSFQPSVM